MVGWVGLNFNPHTHKILSDLRADALDFGMILAKIYNIK